MGDAVISAFFASDKAKAREKARADVESQITSLPPRWELLEAAAKRLRGGAHSIPPFHWNVEFPEVFSRENAGFDAIVGNPPFLGGKRISEEFGTKYRDWLAELHDRSTRNIDLIGHFFLRSFELLRFNGVLGLIGTNTLAQGDTREGSLAIILADGGAISRAEKRLRWPGEAAVVVSVVHIAKGSVGSPRLGGRPVQRISAYLVEGNFDNSPSRLVANSGKSFQGSIVLGMGFTFDDEASAKGAAASLADMNAIVEADELSAEKIFPYIGGDELNTSPTQAHRRFVINVNGLSVEEVKENYEFLFQILDRFVRPERQIEKNKKNGPMYYEWWRYWRERPDLYRAITNLRSAFALSRVSAQMAIARVPTDMVFADSCVVFAFEKFAPFSVLQSRVHEIWARFFSSSMKDDLRYAPSDCFRTFPFPVDFDSNADLETVGEAYHGFRAQLLITRNQGLTKTYNRFHARGENAPDIARLRALHAEMDDAVLRAYGWDDLADRAVLEFVEQDADEGKTPKTRLDWAAEFKDEILARLLALNVERAAAERAAGLAAVPDEDDSIDEDEGG